MVPEMAARSAGMKMRSLSAPVGGEAQKRTRKLRIDASTGTVTEISQQVFSIRLAHADVEDDTGTSCYSEISIFWLRLFHEWTAHLPLLELSSSSDRATATSCCLPALVEVPHRALPRNPWRFPRRDAVGSP